ncbi:hypothetical protein HOLleu_13153 [Holothuria leucospilota]|uniref:C-type lectin domain-containing protein n=1 Tax=Holothuria leucospilota TaxID=206669 RepID=A0A9Q1CC09_HOLLE|nr:hypothetical protein HOLleu_13153 [Holothuria leucospilota]
MCYKRLEDPLAFDDARAACQADGADLASASTPAKNTIVSGLASGQRCWVGAIVEAGLGGCPMDPHQGFVLSLPYQVIVNWKQIGHRQQKDECAHQNRVHPMPFPPTPIPTSLLNTPF